MEKYVCIHGHFYQPPRENPWLEEVELEESALPFHDWNERITAECYAPNAASRILGNDRQIIAITNNYSKISFNIGPTLLLWMKKHAKDTYEAIINADEESKKRFSGHGSAIAQAFNHIIMPLANDRDIRTQVYWGLKTFESNFNRKPEGMWLPETAVDIRTLEALAEFGIKFTILAPHQAARCRVIGEQEWQNVSDAKIDPRLPYLCNLPSGKKINIFFYDGPISNDISFGGLLDNGETLANRLIGCFSDNKEAQLVNIATDGETYGHHHRYGDMALAYCLSFIESNNLAKITIYGEYLEKYPPNHEVEIIEGSSWSCVHGIEHWRSNCGCNSGLHPGWQQEWRKPLREANDWLRDTLSLLYEEKAKDIFSDPWKARDEYIRVILDRSDDNVYAFLEEQSCKKLSDEEVVNALKLLEMQRHAMLMYTSCGWFFDEISGIESTQVMKYASRAIQLASYFTNSQLESKYLSILEKAPSNIEHIGNGRKAYEIYVRPSQVDMLRVGAHYAISSIFEEKQEDIDIYCYNVQCNRFEKKRAGKLTLCAGEASFFSNITFEEKVIAFAALHMGKHNVLSGLKEHSGNGEFEDLISKMKEALKIEDISTLVQLMDDFFGTHNYTLRHLFKDQQRRVINYIFEEPLHNIIDVAFRGILESHYTTMNFLKEIGTPIPKPLERVAEVTLNADFLKLLSYDTFDLKTLKVVAEDAKRLDIPLDRDAIGLASSSLMDTFFTMLKDKPFEIEILSKINDTLDLLNELKLPLYLWRAQNVYFHLTKDAYPKVKEHLDEKDAERWTELFRRVGERLGVRVG